MGVVKGVRDILVDEEYCRYIGKGCDEVIWSGGEVFCADIIDCFYMVEFIEAKSYNYESQIDREQCDSADKLRSLF